LNRADVDAPRPPSPLLGLAELPRASLELSSLLLAGPLLADAPLGDGHDVIVSPGFACSDRSTFLVRRYLSGLGYRVHDWGLGRNLGFRTIGRYGERFAEQVDRISRGGVRPVSLVGHSLGGVISRRHALIHPTGIRQVICIGSPFVGDPRAVNPLVLALHDALTTIPAPAYAGRPRRLALPFTAIYSQSDGVVAPSDCIDAPDERSENIEVYSSHCGLIAHPAVFWAVADRLAQAPDRWTPFRPEGWRRAFYGAGAPAGRAEALAA
jgi:pimeloyl-ACP methyl ester carboxylesterase